MKAAIPHRITRFSACIRLLLTDFRVMYAACTRNTQPGFCRTTTGYYNWVSLFCTITSWFLKHQFNTKRALKCKVFVCPAVLISNKKTSCRKYCKEHYVQRVLSRPAVKTYHCEMTPCIHKLVRLFTQIYE